MPDRDQLYTALRNADAAGDTAGAQRLAGYIKSLPAEDAAPSAVASGGMGAGIGFGKTVLTGQSYLGKGLQKLDSLFGNDTPTISSTITGKKPTGSVIGRAGQWLVDDADMGKRNLDAEIQPYRDAHPVATGAGELGGEIVATLPVGGVLGKGVQSIAALPKLAKAAPQIERLANAVSSGGMRTGAALGPGASVGARVADIATRAAGGGITGGASAALANPDNIGTGALIGAALPPALKGLGVAGRYAGNAGKSLVQPFTEAGQDAIASKIISRFGEGGPMTIDTTQLVPGSLPTLAEATSNAGIAGLQRVARDINPNAFASREAGNASARLAAFDNIAGDAGKLEAATTARGDAAQPLYGAAFTADAMRRDLNKSAQAARAPFTGVGLSGAADDLATPGLRELATRPMFAQAVEDAKRLAANNGVALDDPLQSLQGLHYIKLALDDALNPAAKSAMGRNASNAVMSMRDKLTDELAKVSPLYGNARATFADMSQPINAMEALQKLRLTDSKGDITLSKTKNALDAIKRLRAQPGISPEKSITSDQLSGLNAIHDDLLRQTNLGLGKSAGSNTFQNIATDNIIGSLLPGQLGMLTQNKAGHVLGQIGKLAYSGPNDAIRNRLADMMLSPEMARAALARQQSIASRAALQKFLERPAVQQSLARVAPLADQDRK